MKKDLHHIEDLFRSALGDKDEMPSANVWDAIDSRLDKDALVIVEKKYKSLKKVSLLLVFLLLGLGIYEWNKKSASHDLVKNNKMDYPNSNLPDDVKSSSAVNNSTLENETEQHSAESINLDLNIDSPSSNASNNAMLDQTRGEKPGSWEDGIDAKSRNLYSNKEPFNKTNFNDGKNEWELIPTQQTAAALVVDETINQQINTSGEPNDLANRNINLSTLHAVVKRQLYQPPAMPSFINAWLNYPVAPPSNGQPKTASRFSVTAFFSPDIASYRLKNQSGNHADNATQIKRTERHEFSWTSGLLVDYSLNNNWALQSGLVFSNTNIAVEPKTIYAKPDDNGEVKYRLNISSGYGYLIPSFQPSPVVGDSLKVTAITHKLRYIGIPAGIKYNTGTGKIKFEIMAGVTANFLTMGKVETEIQKGPNNEVDILNKIQGLKSVYFSGMAGVGIENKITSKLSLVVLPTVRFALAPINTGAVVKTYPHSVGLAGGIRFRF